MNRKRLIWEGGVIVVSILLAFAIDAMWDERRERIEEKEILDALATEFRANLEKVSRRIKEHLDFREIVEAMAHASEQEIRALPQEAHSRFVLALCNPKSFDPVLGTTDALIGSGKLELLQDRRLRGALATYLNLAQDAEEDETFVARQAEQLWGREIDLGGPWTDPQVETDRDGNPIGAPDFVGPPSAEDVLRLRQDQVLMGIVGRCHLNVGYYLSELYRLRDQASHVLELIEASR